MLRSIIISPDHALVSELKSAISAVGSMGEPRVLDNYAGRVQLSRALRAHAPQIVFISTDSVQRAISIAEQLEQILPGIQVVAVGGSSTPDTFMALMRGGIREFLATPFDPDTSRAAWHASRTI